MKKRYPFIDVVRGVAIIAMIIFHFLYDLQFLFDQNVIKNDAFWHWVPYGISALFLTVAGIMLSMNYQKKKYNTWRKIIKRSSKIFLFGMVITLVTFFFDFGGKIYFGILHCIALCSLLSFFFYRFSQKFLFFFGFLTVILGIFLGQQSLVLQTPYFFWLFPYYPMAIGPMIDYYPLIPAFGFILLGIFLGKIYSKKTTDFIFTTHAWFAFTKPLQYLGQYSLWIYMLHQPVLYSVLYCLYP